MKTQYEVIVGNIGTVYRGTYGSQALKVYAHYVDISKTTYGRASGESVIMLQDGDIHLEYEPSTGEKE